MKKILFFFAAALACLTARAQEDSFLTHLYLPVDAGASFSSRGGIGGAFYMRASLEYRFDVHRGPFIVGELDTRTHPYSADAIVCGNVRTGDAAYTDILIGPGWRWAFSDTWKAALALQGGVSSLGLKEVARVWPTDDHDLVTYDLASIGKWYPAAKASLMLEFYLNPALDLFLAVGLPVTKVPYAPASADPFVLFPTVSAGFSMALQ